MDHEFFELQLRTLFPSSSTWPSEFAHHKALLAAVNEAVALTREAATKLDNVDHNRDLTPEARTRMRIELADEFVGRLEDSKTLARARKAAEAALQKFEAKINSKLEPATDAQTVGVHAQIHDRLLAIRDPKQRLNFLARHGNDITLISAALSAPPYVSGLSDAELALLRNNLDKHVLPEIIAERDFVGSAMAEIDRGWRAARSRIGKRARLQSDTMGKAA